MAVVDVAVGESEDALTCCRVHCRDCAQRLFAPPGVWCSWSAGLARTRSVPGSAWFVPSSPKDAVKIVGEERGGGYLQCLRKPTKTCRQIRKTQKSKHNSREDLYIRSTSPQNKSGQRRSPFQNMDESRVCAPTVH